MALNKSKLKTAANQIEEHGEKLDAIRDELTDMVTENDEENETIDDITTDFQEAINKLDEVVSQLRELGKTEE